MILGSCPYDDCDGHLMIPIADGPLPRFERHDCEHCKRHIWTRHSRWDPWSQTETEFLIEWTVDPATKVVTRK